MKKTKKIIIISLIFFHLLMPFSFVSADYWGGNKASALLKQTLEEIRYQVITAINATAKMIAIKQATSIIETLLYNGTQRNIRNYRTFLVQDPREKAIAYSQDFLTNSLRGTTSGDYTPASGGSDPLGDAIQKAGESVIDQWKGTTQPSVDYMNYCSNPSDVFADGNYRCFEAIIANPLNTPIGMALAMDAITAAQYEKEQLVAQTTAQSSGVLPQLDPETGDIVLPSSVVEEIQLQRIKLPLEALANGDSSVFSSMIQSFAVSLIVGIVERGLGEVDQAVDQNVKAFQKQYREEMGEYYDTIGPAINYATDAYEYAKHTQQRNAAKQDNDATVNDAEIQMDNSAIQDNPTQVGQDPDPVGE